MELLQQKVKDNKKNTSNIYVIGDVHGCYHTLMKLVTKFQKDSKLIFVGDLVDKGNFSKEVLEYVINNNHQCLLGNHELLMLNYIKESILNGKKSNYSCKKSFGGYKTIEQYRQDMPRLDKHLSWIKTLPKYVQIEKFFITHAFALPYYKRRDSQKAAKGLISNRPSDKQKWGWDWEEGYENYDVINIYGHETVKQIDTSKNYIGIDTGCVYGNKLSSIELNSNKIISTKVDIRDIL